MDKMYVAREQLITSLELFLHDKSPVSVHSLAGNAREILEKICKERGVEAFIDHASDEFPQRKVNELYNIINEYRNCFKHNDPMREDNASLVNFADDKNDHMLLMAIYDYEKAANRMTIPMQVFQTWYFTIYPESPSEKFWWLIKGLPVCG